MFFQFVSTLAFYFNSLYRYIYEGEVTIKFVTINMGGKTHNPFEYVYDTPNHTSFDNYKINLSVLTKSKLMNFLNQEKNQIKFPYFKTFLENINEEIIFNYFFTNETDSKYYLKFDSKIGRNTGYRFNPIEHGYDKISKYIGKYWNEITETNLISLKITSIILLEIMQKIIIIFKILFIYVFTQCMKKTHMKKPTNFIDWSYLT